MNAAIHIPPDDLTTEPPTLGAQIADASREYGRMIRATVERTLQKRITEIEGRLPDADEIAFNGEMQVTEESGIVTWTWKGVPVCEFVAAGYTLGGWRDATISELRPKILS